MERRFFDMANNIKPGSAKPNPVKPSKPSSGPSKSAPVWVKVISILYYIGAAFAIIAGLLLIIGGAALGALFGTMPGIGVLGALGSALFIILGIVFLAVGVLVIFVGINLWKCKKWARIAAIVLEAIGIVFAIIGLISLTSIAWNIVWLIIHLAIGGYLLLGKDVKQAFA
jgi:hypothetical protein